MSKILCITSGLTGITNASFELISRLQKAGHVVEYGSPRDIAEKVKNFGCAFHKFSEVLPDPGPDVPASGKLSRLWHKWWNHKRRKQYALMKMEPSGFIALLKEKAYDIIIVDMELHEMIIAAYALNIRTLLLSQWFSNWKIEGLPYLLSDELPNEDFDFEKHWSKVSRKRKWVFLKKKIKSGGTDRSSLLPLYAKQNNFPQHFMGDNYWPGPFLYDEIPVISMTLQELEFPHVPRKNMKYVGPMVYDQRLEKIDNDLRSKIDQCRKKNQKLIYCSVSTLHAGDISFISKVIDAISTNPDWYLILSLGGNIDPSPWQGVYTNIEVRKEIPQLFVLQNADCSINHGGIHTINECIFFGVPMLVYSGKKSDQNGCAARIHFHEAGIIGDKDKDDVKMISSKIHDILTSQKYRTNTLKFKRQSELYKENKTMESFIDEYIMRKEVKI